MLKFLARLAQVRGGFPACSRSSCLDPATACSTLWDTKVKADEMDFYLKGFWLLLDDLKNGLSGSGVSITRRHFRPSGWSGCFFHLFSLTLEFVQSDPGTHPRFVGSCWFHFSGFPLFPESIAKGSSGKVVAFCAAQLHRESRQ